MTSKRIHHSVLEQDIVSLIKECYYNYNHHDDYNHLTLHSSIVDDELIAFLARENKFHKPLVVEVVEGAKTACFLSKQTRSSKIAKDILLLSGGLDSFIAWEYLDRPLCLFVDLGLEYSSKEKRAVEKLASRNNMELILTSINIGIYKPQHSIWGDTVPLRNLLLTAVAAKYADNIWLVSQKGETDIADRSPRFFQDTSKFFSKFFGDEIKVDTPFWHLTKAKMVEWYLKAGHDPHKFRDTVSCFEEEDGQCGACPACFRRWVSLEANEIGYIDSYNSDVKEWHGIQNYVEKMKNGEYDEQRTLETKAVLEKYNKWRNI